ncbi:nitroreductase family deazaflavin-dependent oxidoreductase [Actinomadura bangladeshensis]|uniref:Nitroreductase family deazaflavin-dependent oxidoreductase n=1 Tax=Actinomadura bangladeshensis TaxID=453573 RepID=A0A4R4P9E1_9ACTN|nr:nitroreductase family deazaflavin-dependent oxidoreductase [Actinomadura bangladeshensis]TDC19161.1 nitroreductase family deazaflavin-dependent oxidoreductase [Actinomadura bangladeshensis]
MEILDRPAPPKGLGRTLARLPVHLYRMHLGRLMRGRFLLLDHTGRKSGRPRQVVLEVIEHADDGYIVCSGFGPKADWYRNVLAHPDVTIQVGRHRMDVTAHRLPPAEGGEIMARYAPRHPKAAARLVRLMGFSVDGTADDYRRVGRELPFLRLSP